MKHAGVADLVFTRINEVVVDRCDGAGQLASCCRDCFRRVAAPIHKVVRRLFSTATVDGQSSVSVRVAHVLCLDLIPLEHVLIRAVDRVYI